MLKYLIAILLILLSFVFLTNVWVVMSTAKQVQTQIGDLDDSRKVALVLGTSRYQVGGGTNLYFSGRMEAVAELYHEGKVKHIIVSGDNETEYYNEPAEMQEALVELKVDKKDITLDYAGFRTLDSVVRCKEVFDQQDFIIVTQQFHGYRAQYISQYYGLNTEVFAANDKVYESTLRMQLREMLARSVAVLDLYVLNTQPRFLGEKVLITR
ncbi:MAG: ElyC/SanA/YdcF family protein [Cyclobacteriaceae bacterium]